MDKKETALKTARLYLAIETMLSSRRNNIKKKTILILSNSEIESEVFLISKKFIKLKNSKLYKLKKYYKLISKNKIVEKILKQKKLKKLSMA